MARGLPVQSNLSGDFWQHSCHLLVPPLGSRRQPGCDWLPAYTWTTDGWGGWPPKKGKIFQICIWKQLFAMRILITGATGFIGRTLTQYLVQRGHEVVACVHTQGRVNSLPKGVAQVTADFTQDHSPVVWLPRLRDIDAVINTVGIIREQGRQTFDALHVKAPMALFSACVEAGVRRIIQFSALGADADAQSSYHRSKKQADDFLKTLPLDWVIMQPSLVYGIGGASARLFNTLASTPVIFLPGKGEQCVQPVYLDDLVECIANLLQADAPRRVTLHAVGPQAMSFAEWLAALRKGMGLPATAMVPVPLPVMKAMTAATEKLPGSILSREVLGMLLRGNCSDPAPFIEVLGRQPRSADEFIPAVQRQMQRRSAQLNWLAPLLKGSLAIVWLVTAIVSFGLYPREQSYRLLERTGVHGLFLPLFLYGAACLDLIFGIATLAVKRGKWLWLGQMALIVLYSIIIAFRLPEFWLHPFGPLIKNIPILAILLLLFAFEE